MRPVHALVPSLALALGCASSVAGPDPATTRAVVVERVEPTDRGSDVRTRGGRWVRGDGEWVWVSDPGEDGTVVVVAVTDRPADPVVGPEREGGTAEGSSPEPTGEAGEPDPRLPPPAERPGDLELHAGSPGR